MIDYDAFLDFGLIKLIGVINVAAFAFVFVLFFVTGEPMTLIHWAKAIGLTLVTEAFAFVLTAFLVPGWTD